jgi:hypothetical protein
MNRGDLNPDLVVAQALKISFLRLYGHRNGGSADLHLDDLKFGEEVLLLVLAQLNTPQSRSALLDVLDFEFDDVAADGWGEVLLEHGEKLVPEMQARLGKQPCVEASRSKPYVAPKRPEFRDKQLKSDISEMSPENRARIAEWRARMERDFPRPDNGKKK